MARRFIVLGLGKFGSAVAKRLHKNGCYVIGVDATEEKVEAMQEFLNEALIADVTDRTALSNLPLKEVDGIFLGLGDHYEHSILASLHLKELGAKRLMAKGVSPEHGRILQKLGVDQVIYPEEEIAVYWADKATWPNVVDFLPIDPEYSLLEIAVPQVLSGRTLLEANLRQKYGIFVIGIKEVLKDQMVVLPPPEMKMHDEQLLLVVGKTKDLERLQNMK